MSIALVALVVGLMLGGVMTSVAVRPRARVRSEAGWEPFVHEIERARRYERPFVVARLPNCSVHPAVPGDEIAHQLPGPAIRRTDHSWRNGPDLYVLLPETGLAEAANWQERMLASGSYEDIRIAGFPDDGLTTTTLLTALGGTAAWELPSASSAGMGETSRAS